MFCLFDESRCRSICTLDPLNKITKIMIIKTRKNLFVSYDHDKTLEFNPMNLFLHIFVQIASLLSSFFFVNVVKVTILT